MASSFEEARDKAESLGVPCRVDATGGGGYTWGDAFYAITDGETTRNIECEFVLEAQISIDYENHEEIPLL